MIKIIKIGLTAIVFSLAGCASQKEYKAETLELNNRSTTIHFSSEDERENAIKMALAQF